MTSIVIPVSTPGAGESADALTRAAGAAAALAKAFNDERVAVTAANAARKQATETAKALANSDRDRLASVKATTQALKEEAVQARQLADQETRDIIAQRAKLATPQHGGGGGGGGGHRPGGSYASAIRQHSGMVSGALTGGGVNAGTILAGVIAGGAMATVALVAGAVGVAGAMLVGSLKKAEENANRFADTLRDVEKGFRDSKHESGQTGMGALGANGKALVAASSQNSNALNVAKDIVSKNPGVSAAAALNFVRMGLSDKQIKAASMAAAISGGDAGAYGEKLKSGRVNMSSAEGMASFLLANEGTFMSPSQVAGDFAQGQKSAAALNSTTLDTANADLNALSPSVQSGAQVESRAQRSIKNFNLDPARGARFKQDWATSEYQTQFAKDASEAENQNGFGVMLDVVGTAFGGHGPAAWRLETKAAEHQAAMKLVIPSGMAR